MNQAPLLLDTAINYAVGAVHDITPALMSHPTPCRGWDLDMLLRHAYESLNTIHEGIRTGHRRRRRAGQAGRRAAQRR